MMTKKNGEAYITYYGDLQESFQRLIDKPQFFETEEGFCGRITDKEFWFYKRYPFIKNSFRTVLYGRIIDNHQICYRYEKRKGVRVVVCFADLIFLALLFFGVVNQALSENPIFPILAYLVPVIVCTLFTVLTLTCSGEEKEALYQQLKKICEKSN